MANMEENEFSDTSFQQEVEETASDASFLLSEGSRDVSFLLSEGSRNVSFLLSEGSRDVTFLLSEDGSRSAWAQSSSRSAFTPGSFNGPTVFAPEDFSKTTSDNHQRSGAPSTSREEAVVLAKPAELKKDRHLYRSHFTVRDAQNVLLLGCCQLKCLEKWIIADFKEFEVQHKGRTLLKRKKHCYDILAKSQSNLDHLDDFTVTVFAKYMVCKQAFCVLFELNLRILSELLGELRNPETASPTFEHGRSGKQFPTQKRSTVVEFMASHLPAYGQRLPHEPKLVLASVKTKKEVYNQLLRWAESMNKDPSKIPGYKQFLNILDKDYPDLQIGVSRGMAYCEMCAQISHSKRMAKLPEQKAEVDKLEELHQWHIKGSHDNLLDLKGKAPHPAYDLDLMMIDGMDQKKTQVPSFQVPDKSTSAQPGLQIHIVGGITSTMEEETYMYYDFQQFPKDANLIAAVLCAMIMNKKTTIRRNLYLQLDNCGGENKNRYLLGFCAALVHFSIYDQVTLMFHPVGHTHVDVDGMFSAVSRKALTVDIPTVDLLVERLQSCYTPNPIVLPLEDVFDMKSWINQYLYSRSNFKGYKEYHYFQLRKDGNGVVRMRFKYQVAESDVEFLPKDCPEGYAVFQAEAYKTRCSPKISQ